MHMVKDKADRILEARKRLAQQVPDPAIALAGSLMKRMIRCNKPGCRHCEKGTARSGFCRSPRETGGRARSRYPHT
jgi:hypothetical protein